MGQMEPQQARDPGIPIVMARLEKLAQLIGERVNDLGSRLDPVLTSDVVPQSDEAAVEDRPPQCSLETELRKSVNLLDRVLDQITDLHRRVDL